MDIRRQVGMNVRRLRKARAWSQENFAFEAGLHRTYVSAIERGIRNPTITIIYRMAKTLDVEAYELLKPVGD
jgi:transcriptional regulator with XRE-family HTH domain